MLTFLQYWILNLTMQIDSEQKVIIVPLEHIAEVIRQYLFAIEVLDKTKDKIIEMYIPIQYDEDRNVTLTVGIVKGLVN